MVFKETRSGISSEENQRTSYLKAEKTMYIHCSSSSVRGEQQGRRSGNLTQSFCTHTLSTFLQNLVWLVAARPKQKWGEATLRKVRHPVLNGHQRLLWPGDETSQWRPLVSKNRLAPKGNAEKKVSLDLCPGNIKFPGLPFLSFPLFSFPTSISLLSESRSSYSPNKNVYYFLKDLNSFCSQANTDDTESNSIDKQISTCLYYIE